MNNGKKPIRNRMIASFIVISFLAIFVFGIVVIIFVFNFMCSFDSVTATVKDITVIENKSECRKELQLEFFAGKLGLEREETTITFTYGDENFDTYKVNDDIKIYVVYQHPCYKAYLSIFDLISDRY